MLRAALASAERDELVSRNVASLVRMPVPRTKAAEVWSVGEARQFLESAKAEEDPLYVAYTLLLLLGLRRGETWVSRGRTLTWFSRRQPSGGSCNAWVGRSRGRG